MPTESIIPDIVAETEQLSTIVRANSLAPETAQSLQASFLPLFTEARGILEKSRGITVTDASQKLEMKLAGECRKALKSVRINADKLRKALKEEYLRGGRAVDGFNAILLHLIDTEETRLEENEKFVERQEATRKAQVKAKREEQLSAFGVDTRFFDLAEMDEPTFQHLLGNTITAHEAKKAAAKQLELDRITKDKADADERERVRLENERLKQEAIAREEAARIEREKAEAARKEAEEKATAERVALEAKHKAEQDARDVAASIERQRVESDRVAAEEKSRKEREVIEEANRQERLRLQALADVERQKVEAEKKAAEESAKKAREAQEKAEAELKAQRDAAAKKAADDAKAAKKAAAAPDKDKLLVFAERVRALIDDLPLLTTPEGKTAAEVTQMVLSEAATRIQTQAEQL